MIGGAKESERLYCLEEDTTWNRQAQLTINSNTTTSSEIMLWHYRLGHPSFPYLQKFFPSLFRNNISSLFQCEISQFAKYHHTVFPSCPYKESKTFSLMHTDIWGPTK